MISYHGVERKRSKGKGLCCAGEIIFLFSALDQQPFNVFPHTHNTHPSFFANNTLSSMFNIIPILTSKRRFAGKFPLVSITSTIFVAESSKTTLFWFDVH